MNKKISLPIEFEIEQVHSNLYATFTVPTRDHGNVYMSATRTNYMNEDRFVVIVDAKKFLELWKSEPSPLASHSAIAHGSSLTWPLDKKFSQAVKGFSHGKSNPVPLAEVNCHIHTKNTPIYKRHFIFWQKQVSTETQSMPYAAFTNGVTRTAWLLHHGAEYFPVETHRSSADLLNTHAGLTPDALISIDALIPKMLTTVKT